MQYWVLDRHFYFQILTIFVTVLSGSITSVIKSFFNNPQSLVSLLGTAVPGMGAYFMQILVTKCAFSTTLELARPWALLVETARTRYHSLLGTRRTADGLMPVEDAPEFKVGEIIPQFLMVVLIGILFAPIAPLTLPIAALFFALCELVYARAFIFVYVRRFEDGGQMLWPTVTFFTTTILLVAQVTLFSYLSIMGAVLQLPLLVPLPIVTVRFYQSLVRRYERPAYHLDRNSAVEHGMLEKVQDLRSNFYHQPALRESFDIRADPRDPNADSSKTNTRPSLIQGQPNASTAPIITIKTQYSYDRVISSLERDA